VSRATVHKWLRRHAEAGEAGLADRSSRPYRMPARTPARVEARVLAARRRRHRGAVVLAAELGLNPSTVGRILARHRVPRLATIDPITGQPVRGSRRSPNRYEHDRPGSMIHVDVKKLGRIPPGGGWRLLGRDATAAHKHKRVKIGYDYVHTAIDDHTRLAYSEVLADEKDTTCAAFLHRALTWFTDHGITVGRVLTDNAMVYRHGTDWAWVCSAWQLKRRFTKPGSPLDERQSRTLQPHPAPRVGLRPPLDHQPLPPRPWPVPPPLQHSMRPLRPRRTPTHHQAHHLTTMCQVTTSSRRQRSIIRWFTSA